MLTGPPVRSHGSGRGGLIYLETESRRPGGQENQHRRGRKRLHSQRQGEGTDRHRGGTDRTQGGRDVRSASETAAPHGIQGHTRGTEPSPEALDTSGPWSSHGSSAQRHHHLHVTKEDAEAQRVRPHGQNSGRAWLLTTVVLNQAPLPHAPTHRGGAFMS